MDRLPKERLRSQCADARRTAVMHYLHNPDFACLVIKTRDFVTANREPGYNGAAPGDYQLTGFA